MKKERKISLALATASCALIGSTGISAEDKHEVGDWDVSAAILFYQESDDRVQAFEPVITAKKHLDTDETLTFKLTLDSLTGSSPNGAVPSNVAQTFTQPSGNGVATIDANEYPLDDTFQDTRYALNTAWEKPLAKDWRMSLGANASKEYDYTSFGVSSVFAHDINNKNTTLSGGVAVAFDSIDPEGAVPIAFAEMTPAGTTQPRQGSSEDKTIFDVLAGVSQVIDRYSLFQVNYSVSYSDGYLTDPFKVISVVDNNGVPVFAGHVTQPGLPTVVYENRPDTRLKHSLYGQYKRALKGGDVIDTSYRLMVDDWGITSHTVDARYRWEFDHGGFLQPHVRIYQQSEADFYTPFYLEGSQPLAANTSAEGSADNRLGEFMAYTVGLEYGQDNARNSWSAAVEYYLQTGDEPSGTFGELKNQELVPDIDALMLRVIYDF